LDAIACPPDQETQDLLTALKIDLATLSAIPEIKQASTEPSWKVNRAGLSKYFPAIPDSLQKDVEKVYYGEENIVDKSRRF
jgi:hypothetical protein